MLTLETHRAGFPTPRGKGGSCDWFVQPGRLKCFEEGCPHQSMPRPPQRVNSPQLGFKKNDLFTGRDLHLRP